ncbi:class I SAM-dependent methyltransferase [Risungbinella massiliensis]|uniref:class I SAM-dependent methyltransferase n=1 Tax=Risungbinella massiliensis TaxID=1329796 RepID=UPI0005CC8C2E|nr:protein distantly related to SAM-dependent methyltransferase [Risungbinella massiliensis]
MKRVVIGTGEQAKNNPNWIHTNQEDLDIRYTKDWANLFVPCSITAILAEHVWEHMTWDEGLQAAKNCYHYLKCGGYVRCAVPDGYFPDHTYQKLIQVGGPGSKDHSAASHKIVFTYHTFRELFELAGFQVTLLEYFDEQGRFHHKQWDPAKGLVYRTYSHDHRNQNGKIGFTSILLDAVK